MKKTLLILLLTALITAPVLAEEFFDERYFQLSVGTVYLPYQTSIVVADLVSKEIPTYEFIDRHLLAYSARLQFPIREWFKLGVQFAWSKDTFAYEDEGRMESEFDLDIKHYFLAFQMPISLLRGDWIDITLSPFFAYYGASQSPENIDPSRETRTDVWYRASCEWSGVGFGGTLGAAFYFGDFMVGLEGGWLQGGIDVDRKLYIEDEEDDDQDYYLDPSSTMGGYLFSVEAGYFF
ncbi:MAG: hypothetical protein GF399_05010 [Candidatus Coatesbacteria bacterium]|nr:hypothetical protein [Candidatus Coatesbacteria bacterium]